ncbi:hypothetical protein AVEN_129859-1 [Araneus ventricosus]|uniref:Uncharacterized protein n=1 Tax=Araneus ventricosus TaxID=182803 RepID=A0A4Y2JDY5_ARAVE|nr:hypothetical protein AVEN_129859-1 [Araneus ventricosus]
MSKQETFGDVYTTYMSYIKRHYGDEVTVVSDGYTESSVNTKGKGKSKIGSIALKICRILILGSNAKKSILFVHAISGCDTTSGFYRKRKLQAVQFFNLSKYLQDIPEIFNNPKSTYTEIERAGETFMIALYRNKKKEESILTQIAKSIPYTLLSYHFDKFLKMPRGRNGCNHCCERNHCCGTPSPAQNSECCRGDAAPPAQSSHAPPAQSAPAPPANEKSSCERFCCHHQTSQNRTDAAANRCCCICVCVKCCDPQYC